MTQPHPTHIHHVRLTVTDIHRSKAFYTELFGQQPAIDFSDQVGDPEARLDPQRFFGGCVFALDAQLFGLRPVAEPGDTFSSVRVGLDHVSLAVAARSDLDAAVARLDAEGVVHGEIIEMAASKLAILSFQDPDDINLELTAPLP